MDELAKQKAMKALEEMNVIDDFLFSAIMSDDVNGLEVCRIILSCVLKKKVGNITYNAQRTVPGVTERSHGIRMDAYVSEKNENGEDISVYDVEPDKNDTRKAQLPKRSRYYGDLIDSQLLKISTAYDKLPELVSIFILSYDPFGENAMYYEAGTVLKTHPGVQYDDGIRRIFLYTEGDLPDGSGEEEKSLQSLLKYINKSTSENVVDENTRKLDNIVKGTKAKKDIGVRYMKSWEWETEIREKATEEGLAVGLAEGRAAGLAEGRAEGLEEGRAEERANTERERKRAEEAEKEAKDAKERIAELEALLAKKQ